jgi:hypothetical protein
MRAAGSFWRTCSEPRRRIRCKARLAAGFFVCDPVGIGIGIGIDIDIGAVIAGSGDEGLN